MYAKSSRCKRHRVRKRARCSRRLYKRQISTCHVRCCLVSCELRSTAACQWLQLPVPLAVGASATVDSRRCRNVLCTVARQQSAHPFASGCGGLVCGENWALVVAVGQSAGTRACPDRPGSSSRCTKNLEVHHDRSSATAPATRHSCCVVSNIHTPCTCALTRATSETATRAAPRKPCRALRLRRIMALRAP